MHYKNGREAKVGDVVVHETTHFHADGSKQHGKHTEVGRIVSITPGAMSCNALVVPTDIGRSINLNQSLHIEDAADPLTIQAESA